MAVETKSAKHTPGPWTSRGSMVYGSGTKVAEVPSMATTPGSNLYHPETLANARLIAAAPEMLAALKVLVSGEEGYGDMAAAMNAARTAIAKAEGT